MTCERRPNTIARLAGQVSAGIARLAGKRSFYAGLALGGAGLVGTGLIALARRRSRPASRRNHSQPAQRQLIDLQQIRQLEARPKVKPRPAVSSSERCAGCQTPAGKKPGAWYTLAGRSYCPDCAPAAARQAEVDLVAPVTAAGAGAGDLSVSTSGVNPLPPAGRIQTRLAPSRVGVYAGQGPEGPTWYAVNNGYVVLQPDGTDTGLALTPALKLNHRTGQVEEDTGRWWVTHIPSGKNIPGAGPYARSEEAHLLAGVLAQLDWTRAEAELSPSEIRQVGATVSAYNAALAGEKNRQPPAGPTTDYTTSRKLPAGPLDGKLVADGYGGVARVLDVSPDDERLFVINSLGERYEIARRQARTPDESDFEAVRVAMSFDPAKNPAASCATCGRSTRDSDGGERWYKMNRQAFCQACATRYAAEEAYAREEAIGDELELAS